MSFPQVRNKVMEMNEVDKRGRATLQIVKEKLRKGIEPSALQKRSVAEWLRDASEQVIVPAASLLLWSGNYTLDNRSTHVRVSETSPLSEWDVHEISDESPRSPRNSRMLSRSRSRSPTMGGTLSHGRSRSPTNADTLSRSSSRSPTNGGTLSRSSNRAIAKDRERQERQRRRAQNDLSSAAFAYYVHRATGERTMRKPHEERCLFIEISFYVRASLAVRPHLACVHRRSHASSPRHLHAPSSLTPDGRHRHRSRALSVGCC